MLFLPEFVSQASPATGPPCWAKQPTSMTVPEIASASGEMRKAIAFATSSPVAGRPAAVPGAPWPSRAGSPPAAAKTHAGDDTSATRYDSVHTDAVMQEIVGHCRTQREHASLAGAIGGHVGLSPSGAGADVDDGPAAHPDHVRQHGAAAQIRPLQIDRHDPVERRFVGIQHRAQRTDRRVVDQGIDSSMTCQRRLDDVCNVTRVRYVGFHQVGFQAALLQLGCKPGNGSRSRARYLRNLQTEGHNGVPECRQTQRDGAANPESTAGHDDNARGAHSAALCVRRSLPPSNSSQSPPPM